MRRKLALQLVALAGAGVLCAAAGFNIGRLSVLVHPAKSTAAASKLATFPKMGDQGLTVHGWWSLRVTDTTGHLIADREFENSLVTGFNNGGDSTLTSLLTRQFAMGPWRVIVTTSGGGFTLSGAADLPADGPLSVSGNNNTAHVILSGRYTPNADISITQVATGLSLCSNNTAPNACVNYFGDPIFAFTSSPVGPNLAVANGQQVQVTVDISFS